MNNKIYSKIEILVYNNINNSGIRSTNKVDLHNVSIKYSGNFVIFTTYEKDSQIPMVSTPYNLDTIKAYKIIK